MYLKPMRYIGNKHHFIPTFLELETQLLKDSTENWTFIEPFVGSGSIFLNKQSDYAKTLINDKDRNLMRIWQSFKDFDVEEYCAALSYVEGTFGDIKNSKPAWYEFRNWFNKTHWKTDTFVEGVYLLLLVNTTINSIFRFGPNGFNSSYGGRYMMPSLDTFKTLKEQLKDTEITTTDYTACIEDTPNTLYFIDPPYYSRSIQSYVENFESDDIFKDFLVYVKNFKHAKVIYTDIINDINESYMYNWNMKNIKEVKNIGPSVNGNKTSGYEVVYYNF